MQLKHANLLIPRKPRPVPNYTTLHLSIEAYIHRNQVLALLYSTLYSPLALPWVREDRLLN
jgi:hypothetical protein